MSIPSRRPVTSALKDFLCSTTGRPFRTGIGPQDEDGNPEEIPYGVIWPEQGNTFSGPGFVAPQGDAAFHYIIHSVGLRDDQAEWMADEVRKAILERDENGVFLNALEVPGLKVMDRRIGESSGPLDRSGNVYTVAEEFVILVTTS